MTGTVLYVTNSGRRIFDAMSDEAKASMSEWFRESQAELAAAGRDLAEHFREVLRRFRLDGR